MGLFHATGEAKDRAFTPLVPEKFAAQHKEDHIQAWVDTAPAVLNDGQPMLTLGREIVTDHNSYIDNLYLDGNGVLVAAEMKRGRTPRDVLAQISEYAAYIDKLTWADIEAFSLKRHGKPLDKAYSAIFGRPVTRTAKPEHRLMVVAEDFRPEIVETAAYHISRGMPLALLQFTYYSLGAQAVLDVQTVMGEIPEQQMPSVASPMAIVGKPDDVTPRTMSDDGYSNWLLSGLEGYLGQQAQQFGWVLNTRLNKQTFLFNDTAWGVPLATCQLRADTYFSSAVALRLIFRTSALPDLQTYLEQHRDQWADRFAAEFEAPAYETPNTTLTLKLPRPPLGDQAGMAQVESQLGNMATVMLPLLASYFASRAAQAGAA